MKDVYLENAHAYAAQHGLQVAERLGFGIHGIIHVVESNTKAGKTAIKIHREKVPYLRECEIYEMLKAAQVTEIQGFHVPQLLGTDHEHRIIEMTIVTRPFVLDFAGAYPHERPVFSDEAWGQWEAEKKDQFGDRWSTVQAILEDLEELEIYLVDISPSNIAFQD